MFWRNLGQLLVICQRLVIQAKKAVGTRARTGVIELPTLEGSTNAYGWQC